MPAAKRKNNLSTGRDYSRDSAYLKTPAQRKANASRKAARRAMEKKVGKAALKGKDVDHRDGNPLNNKPGNLRVITPAKNRARK